MGFIRRLLSSRSAIALLLIVALGAFLRFFAIGAKTVWLDEAFSIWVANHGIVDGLALADPHRSASAALLLAAEHLAVALRRHAGQRARLFCALQHAGHPLRLPGRQARITRDTVAGLIAALYPGTLALPRALCPGSAHVRTARRWWQPSPSSARCATWTATGHGVCPGAIMSSRVGGYGWVTCARLSGFRWPRLPSC